MVKKRAQIYQQEIDLIEKATAELMLTVAELEEEDIDSSPVEELVEVMKKKYGPESMYRRTLTAAMDELLRYVVKPGGEDSSQDWFPMEVEQTAAEAMLSYRMGSLPVGSTGADSGAVVDDKLPGYEEMDTVGAPPGYDG